MVDWSGLLHRVELLIELSRGVLMDNNYLKVCMKNSEIFAHLSQINIQHPQLNIQG